MHRYKCTCSLRWLKFIMIPGVSLRDGHQPNWMAEKMILPPWFEHPEERFLRKKFSLKGFAYLWKPAVLLLRMSIKPLVIHVHVHTSPLTTDIPCRKTSTDLPCLMYFSSSTDPLVFMWFLFALTRDTNILSSYLWFLTVGTCIL